MGHKYRMVLVFTVLPPSHPWMIKFWAAKLSETEIVTLKDLHFWPEIFEISSIIPFLILLMVKLHLFQLVTSNAQPTPWIWSSFEVRIQCLENSFFFFFWRKWWASLVAQTIKNRPAVQEISIWSLGQEELLEKGMATHSIILAWIIPRT